MRLQAPHLPPVFGLLDVGTAKIVCLMLSHRAGSLKLIGVGHQVSRGLKAGVIVDPDAAEDAVRAAVAQAEHMAGTILTPVILAAACGRMASQHLSAGLDLDTARITDADSDGLMDAGRQHAERDDRAVLHLNAIATRIDGQPFTGPASGRRGQHLAVDLHAVAADRSAVRHLLHLAERCQLQVHAMAPAPLSSALAVTTEAERQRGVLVIDLGAGATGVALFVDGLLVAVHVHPIGSNHLTYDLARALGAPLAEAERIKKNCAILGSAQPVPVDTLAYQTVGDDPADSAQGASKQVTRAHISTLLTSRVGPLLEQIQQRLEPLGLAAQRYGDVVLTGGGSVLGGLVSEAHRAFGLPVRVGAPLDDGLLPALLRQPAFATAAGLAAIARNQDFGFRFDVPLASMRGTPHTNGSPDLKRQNWARQSF